MRNTKGILEFLEENGIKIVRYADNRAIFSKDGKAISESDVIQLLEKEKILT